MLRPYRTRPLSLGSHRQNRHPLDRVTGPLRVEIKAPQRDDFVAPPFQTRRGRHPEAVHVEDAAAHAELRDFRHGGHTAVSHGLEAPDGVAERTAPRSLL